MRPHSIEITDPDGKRPPYFLALFDTLGGPYVRIRLPDSDADAYYVAHNMTAEIDTEGYTLTITTAVDDQLCPEIDRMTIERKPGAPPIHADILNRLGCGDALARMVEYGSWRVAIDPETGRETLTERGPFPRAPKLAFARRRPDNPTIDAEARQVAALYREAHQNHEPAPRRYVKERLSHLSERTITRRRDYAIDHGYLDDTEGTDNGDQA
jgi:hypothetical protein